MLKQGDLDGACGFYAIVHAVAQSTGMNKDQAFAFYDELMTACIRGLNQNVFKKLLVGFVGSGTTAADLEAVVNLDVVTQQVQVEIFTPEQRKRGHLLHRG